MKKMILAALMALVLPAAAHAAPVVGSPAPAFTGTDSKGVTHNLADFKGKTVVLEWTNAQCPYVRKFYDAGAMQALQKEATDSGVVWISINSSAAGKQGNLTPEAANKLLADEKSAASALILDADGTIGRLYDAKTTPHMYVINPEGVLVYQGAIDNNPSPDAKALEGAKNYVKQALSELAEGKPVSESLTQAYGCTVKY